MNEAQWIMQQICYVYMYVYHAAPRAPPASRIHVRFLHFWVEAVGVDGLAAPRVADVRVTEPISVAAPCRGNSGLSRG